jgi:hypothetical protein
MNRKTTHKKGSMTVKQAGHLGGEKTSEEKHGTGFYKNIGHKGGVAAAKNQGKGQFAKGAQKDTSLPETQEEEKNESLLDKIF